MHDNVINNINNLEDGLLDFSSNDNFYIIKVIVRRKDVIDSPEYKNYHELFGSHHERFINWYTVRSKEDYHNVAKLVRCICDNNPFRAYICTDVKSYVKTINNLNNYVEELYKEAFLKYARLIQPTNFQYKKIEEVMKSVASKVEATTERNKQYILLDIDTKETKLRDMCIKLYLLVIRQYNYRLIYYETFCGHHMFIPFDIFSRINYQINKPNEPMDEITHLYTKITSSKDVSVKKNAMAILYANGDNLAIKENNAK